MLEETFSHHNENFAKFCWQLYQAQSKARLSDAEQRFLATAENWILICDVDIYDLCVLNNIFGRTEKILP